MQTNGSKLICIQFLIEHLHRRVSEIIASMNVESPEVLEASVSITTIVTFPTRHVLLTRKVSTK
jgi:hypothetical protein